MGEVIRHQKIEERFFGGKPWLRPEALSAIEAEEGSVARDAFVALSRTVEQFEREIESDYGEDALGWIHEVSAGIINYRQCVERLRPRVIGVVAAGEVPGGVIEPIRPGARLFNDIPPEDEAKLSDTTMWQVKEVMERIEKGVQEIQELNTRIQKLRSDGILL